MKKNISIGILFMSICLLSLTMPVMAQVKKTSKASNKIYDVKLVGFRKDNKIYLRWLLSTAAQWRKANENGYIIERAEKESTHFIPLNTQPIKPIVGKSLLKLDKNSNAVKLMGIVLHKPDDSKPSNKMQDQTLYGMYFMLSSFETNNALMSASAWVDSTIQPNKAYTYRITVANTSVELQNRGLANLEAVDNSFPAPPEIEGDFVKKSAKLTWNNKKVLESYFAIVLEKSTDSIHFTRVTKNPFLTNVSNKDIKADENSFKTNFTDTAVKLNTKYFYRLKGLNIFGLESYPSKVFSGIVTLDLTEAPRIHFVDTLKGKYLIDWEMPRGQNALVAKYQVLYSTTGKESDYKILKDIKGGEKMVASVDIVEENSNYFKIKAIGHKKEESLESAPYLYQLKDSTPPAVPAGLAGTIDKKGIVRLHWHKNTEKDFRGYKVVKRYNNNSAFSLLNTSPQTDTTFVDSLPLNQLSLKSSYSVTALDNLYNESEKSAFITLTAPDTIAPAPPRIKSVLQMKDKGVQLQWVKSFSPDVDSYVIFRKEIKDTITSWTKYAEKTKEDTSFIDNAISSNTGYYYKMVAIDKGGLKSRFTDSVKIKLELPKEIIPKVISKLNVYIAKEYKYIELNWWTDNTEDVSEFRIYRTSSRSKNQATMLASLPISIKKYVDEDIVPNTVYTYYIKAVYQSGKSSPFEKIEAAY